jgi:regulator of sigma E protease
MGVTIISFIIVLGVLVFVHEFGHFMVARLCGVGVEKFSIGFGPKLFGWKRGRTDYMVSAIPLGGYVKMVGEEPDAELDPEEIPYSFTHKKVWQRFLIVGAGPFFNLVLAIVIYFFLYWVHGTYYYPSIIGEIEKDSPAFNAGLMVGDEVLSVDSKKIKSASEFEKIVKKSNGKELLIKINRSGDEKDIVVKPLKLDSVTIFGEDTKEFKIGAAPYIPPVIGSVSKDSPAFKAGIKNDDIIRKIDNEDVDTWHDVSRLISKSKGDVEIVFERAQEYYTKKIKPELKEFTDHLGKKSNKKIIGVAAKDISLHEKLGPIGAFNESFLQTWKVIELTGVGIVKMIDGTISKENLGGPIMIAQMAGDQAKRGVTSLLAFICLISINLGLLNLLPVPILDGGHLMFFLIEGISGKPVSIKGREIAQQIGLALLLLLMGFAFYNDIVRVISG